MRTRRLPSLSVVLVLLLGAAGLWYAHVLRERPRVLTSVGDARAVAFSPNGKTLALGQQSVVEGKAPRGYWSYATGAVQFRNVQSGQATSTVPFFAESVTEADMHKNGGPVGWLAYSPDGRFLMASNMNAGNADTVGIWDVRAARWTVALRGHSYAKTPYRYLPVGFSSDGKTAFILRFLPANVSEDKLHSEEDSRRVPHTANLSVCDILTGRVVRVFSQNVLAGGQWPEKVGMLKDGKTAVIGSRLGGANGGWTQDNMVSLVDTDTGRVIRIFGAGGNPLGSAKDTGLSAVSSTSNNGNLMAWRAQRVSPPQPGTVQADSESLLAMSPDGKFVAGWARDGSLGLWSVPQDKLVRTVSHEKHEAWVATFSPDGHTLGAAYRDKVKLWNVP